MKKFEVIERINRQYSAPMQEGMLAVFNMLCDTTYELHSRRVSYKEGSEEGVWKDAYTLYKKLGV